MPASTARPIGTNPPADGPERRTRILRAAAVVITQRGIRGLRVDEVAERAEVSTALIYYHFDNRAGLVNAALGFSGAKVRAAIRRAVAKETCGYDALVRLLVTEIDESRSVRAFAIFWGEVGSAAVRLRPET